MLAYCRRSLFMATQQVPRSEKLYYAAEALKDKGRYARAAEKFGDAAAAAAQELAAEDCLVVALLRAAQADALICHGSVPSLAAAERGESLQTVLSVLLPQLVSTLTRRKAAGTLLPGSCRAAEVAWERDMTERKLLKDGMPVKEACACAVAAASEVGLDAYMYAATDALKLLEFMEPYGLARDMQLSQAAFVASAFELLARPRVPLFVIVDGVYQGTLPSPVEQGLAQVYRIACTGFNLDREVRTLMADAWRHVELSGAVVMRELGDEPDPAKMINTRFAAAAADAAVRGLRECALVGCASKEVHVSQFKRCAACQQAFYCCREHQLADWPSHKAACKAARKADTAGASGA